MGSLPNQSKKGSKLESIAGSPPDLSNLPKGCSFAPRCKYAEDICLEERPELTEIEPGHVIRCHCRDKVQGFKGIISVPDQKGGGDE
jgi:oligopeptide/dipeptide ABC transporter ATP-binding protein